MAAGIDGHDGPAGLRGLHVDLVTPLRSDGSLDPHALEALLLQVSPDRFAGVVLAGVAGEGRGLSLDLQAQLTRLVVEGAPGLRWVLPVAVGTSPDGILADLEVLASSGATAALVSPRSPGPSVEGAVAGFLAEVVGRSPLPIVVYHAPGLTGVPIPLPVVADLAGEETVIGVVDAGSDTGYLTRLVLQVQDLPGFGVLGGGDAGLLASVLVGASGAVSAAANVVPRLVAETYSHSVTRSLHSARTSQRRLLSVVDACGRYGTPGGWKAAASMIGLCEPIPAVPGGGIGAEDARRLRSELVELGVAARSR